VNPTDDQHLRQRLHEDLGALEISPAPVLRVTGRGQGIRVRRRALAAGTAILATLAVVAAAQFNGPAAAPSVTLNQPNPAAPGGVFASGTADGKRWTLAVRNIAAAPGTHWCLPAVMFNGHNGDVLFKLIRRTPTFGNPAFLAHVPGFPGIGAVFTQVAPGETRLVGTSPDGRSISARAVQVRACGTTFNLAGFAFAQRHPPAEIATYGRFGLGDGLIVNIGTITSLFGPTAPGIWANLDKSRSDIAASQARHPIGTGTVSGQIWHIWASLGLYGQCYTANLRTPGAGRGQSPECVPVAAPPRTAALIAVPVSGAQAQLSGYAGLVSPRTAYGYASISDGTTRRVVPVRVAGRAYIALVVPAGCQVTRLSLFDASGHLFPSVGRFTQVIPWLKEPPGSAGSS
jgi:hypothetical protein